MLRELAFVFFLISVIFKTLGLRQIQNQKLTVEQRKKAYARYNIPSYLFIAAGVGILLYLKYLA